MGSGAAAIVCAVVALAASQGVGGETGLIQNLMSVGFVASFASKLGDTVSSEIGKAYGKTTYLATTLSLVPRGTEGAVSLEGTAAGVMAALLIGVVSMLLGVIDHTGLICVTMAAFIANYVESLIGASLQGSVRWLNNDVVNVIQITIAAILAIVMFIYFQ